MKHTSLKMVFCFGILLVLCAALASHCSTDKYRAATPSEQKAYAEQDSAKVRLYNEKPRAVIP
jgi:hypothetical protein